MPVLEGLVDRVVEVAVGDFVSDHTGGGLGELVQLPGEILPLLVGALGGGGQRGQLRVDLQQELVQLAEVEGPALVAVVLLEQPVQAAQVVGGLREALLHALRDVPPLFERDVHFLRVPAFLVGERAEEGDEVVGDVVLDGGAVSDGVDGAKGGAAETEVRVGF